VQLIHAIRACGGARGRSAFLAELAVREIKRRRMLEILKSRKPVWKDKDHPELRGGAAKWVRKIRAESEARFERIQQQRDRD
jgi:hypothetical protein